MPRHIWHKLSGHSFLDGSATAHLAQNLLPILLRHQCHGTPGTKCLATLAETPVPRHTWHKISGHFAADTSATAHLAHNFWPLLLQTPVPRHTWHKISGRFCSETSATAHPAQNLYETRHLSISMNALGGLAHSARAHLSQLSSRL